MLEWKFRVVFLLSAAGAVAAALGNLTCLFNYNW
jgi:hypothetical protein